MRKVKRLKSIRYNLGKPRWSLLHYPSIEPLVRVMEYGERKYTRNNWKIGLDKLEILDSLSRHLFALINGEERDKETKELHAGHIMANAMFYIYHVNEEIKKNK